MGLWHKGYFGKITPKLTYEGYFGNFSTDPNAYIKAWRVREKIIFQFKSDNQNPIDLKVSFLSFVFSLPNSVSIRKERYT